LGAVLVLKRKGTPRINEAQIGDIWNRTCAFLAKQKENDKHRPSPSPKATPKKSKARRLLLTVPSSKFACKTGKLDPA
jgi:hypothetical protein